MKRILFSLFALVLFTNVIWATNVTFSVDMTNVTGFTTPFVSGSFNSWAQWDNPMADPDMDNIWTATIDIAPGTYEYKFQADGWAQQENLAPGSSCTITTGAFTNRTLVVAGTPVVQATVCWASCSSCSSVVPITFRVDMNGVTGFTQPTVNGSFNGWSGNANPLTDSNSDGIWETTISLPPGNYEYKFAADNWGIQESLAPGLPCTITTGAFTNRSLSVSAAATLPVVCWNACVDCASVIPIYNVTFQVDMTLATGYTIPEVNGTFNNWCGSCTQMSDSNNDNIWTVTVPLQAGSYEYKYSYGNWAGQETLTSGSSCTITTGANTNRALNVTGDMTIPVVCYGTCSACVLPTYNVTFQVDMSNVTGYTTPEVNGTFNSWCGNCIQMTDANNDDIWTVTVPLTQGVYEYKYSHDGWAGQENLTAGNPCTVTNGGFTNRSLTVNSDMTLPVVCYGSCNICSPPTYNVTFRVDMTNQPGVNPTLNGTFNGWCGDCAQMTDANNDNIWEITVPLQSGAYEYKYVHGAWISSEQLVEGSSCTVTAWGFTNRSLLVGSSNIVLPVVCYGACSACMAQDSPAGAPMVSSANSWYPQCQSYAGSLQFAANSPESNAFTGPDHWYRFVATSTAVSIQLTHGGMDAAIQLLNSSLAPIPGATENASSATSGVETLNFDGLTIGQTYYVSVSAVGAAGGDYNVCIKQLLQSACNTNVVSPLNICSSFKTKWTGANSYTLNFSPVSGSTGGGTGTVTGATTLSNPAFGLIPGNSYNLIVNANYTSLANANGDDVDITVFGSNPSCVVTIAAASDIQVRASQRCNAPATLLPTSFLRTDPYNCGVTNYTFEFTPVAGCNDNTSTGISFTSTHNSRIIPLTLPSGTNPSNQAIQPQTYYSVRVRPNYGVGGIVPGTFGTAHIIFVGGSVLADTPSFDMEEQNDERINEENAEAVIYPNPNDGNGFILNAINLNNPAVRVTITDALGKTVYSKSYNVDGYINTTIQTPAPLANGLYFVQLADGDRFTTFKMVVE
jgi:hypothetical protein